MKKNLCIIVSILLVLLFLCMCIGKTKKPDDKTIRLSTVDNNLTLTDSTMKTMLDSDFIQTLGNKDMILRRLKVQNDWENLDPFDNEYFNTTEEDLKAGFAVEYYIMLHKGFIPVSDSMFHGRIREVFGIDFNHKSFYVVDHPDFFTRLIPSDIDERNDVVISTEFHSESRNYYFFKKEKMFITRMPLVSGMLDSEGRPYQNGQIYYDDNYHCNNFVFHNDRQSLAWLIVNDISFLEKLVREFGYCTDANINKAVMEKIFEKYDEHQPSDLTDLTNLYAMMDRDGKLQIREDLIEYVLNNTTRDDRRQLDMLESYVYLLMSSLRKPEGYDRNADVYKYFSRDNKIEIVSRLAYSIQPLYHLYASESADGLWNRSPLDVIVRYNDITEYLASVNWYNLPGYLELIEKGSVSD